MRQTLLDRPLPLAMLVFGFSWALFVVRLAVPHILVFDEVHYVPAARTLLALAAPANIEHPLLGKELIAFGMMLAGDGPLGWRLMSTIAGAATVTAMFATALAMTGRTRDGLLAAALTLLGFTVYVQARIAMLDGFMCAFLTGAIAAFAWGMRRGGWGRWLAGSALLGAAVACKWVAAPYVAFAGIAFLLLKRGDPQRWPGLPTIPALLALGGVSVTVYFATFAPAFFYADQPLSLSRLIPFQLEMYQRQTQVLPPHTYQSNWWTWPLLIRPIWYLYEPTDGAQRGILMLGNPAIMWGGLVAVALCWWGWVKDGSTRLLAAAGLWTASLAIWAVIPKSLGFYYYYYPSSVFLVLAIVAAYDHWRLAARRWMQGLLAISAVLALYFFPVLSALPLPAANAFQYWTWMPSWV